MVAVKIFKTILLILTFSISSIFASTYYIDAVNGNDSNNGTSSSTAWKTLAKVNSTNFNPGDQISFNRGNTWVGALIPSSSGTSSNRIVYGAYGTGRKPVITLIQPLPGSQTASNWTKTAENVYFLKCTLENLRNEGRIWLSDKEYEWSQTGPGGVNSVNRWCIANAGIYVYAESNPVSYYSSVKYPGFGMDYQTLKLQDRDYLTFQNLDLRGGFNTIALGGSDYNIIEDCNICYGSQGRGILSNAVSGVSASDENSEYNIIRRDTIDSGWRVRTVQTLQNREIMDAISLQNGANHWEIYENYFRDWDHSSVQMYGIKASVNYNKVYKNYITAPDIAFARAFEIMGMEPDLAQYNEIYQNHIDNETVRSQVGGYYTKIYYNIFSNMTNSITTYLKHVTAEGINIANFAGSVAGKIKVYNNTFYGLDRTGIWTYVAGCEFTNNLFIDCGRKQSGLAIRVTGSGDEGSTWKNNIIYTPGASTSSLLIDWNSSSKTINQFNSTSGGGVTISGNMQYSGSLSALVKNAADGDFCPAQSSFALNKGLSCGTAQDFYGNPIVGNPDVGAIEFANSTPSNDQVGPKLLDAVLINPITLKITFSEKVNPDFAQNIHNYGISNSITINEAALNSTQTEVTLKTSAHKENVDYTVSVNNVIDIAGNRISSSDNAANYELTTGVTSTNDGNSLSGAPAKFELNQNYPNPFNPTTRIKYTIAQPTNVTIKIYDMLGAEVMTLVNQQHVPGYYEVSFNGSNLASGTYIYQIRTNNFVETKKMMLIK
jgi:hypothetical protein